MKRIVSMVLAAVLGLGLMAHDVEAKRLGGGATSGMKRQTPPPQPAQPTPPSQGQQAQPAQQPGLAGAAPAAAPKRSWMGPIAGLAAGLGLAALASHFGLGGELANLMTMLLLAGAAFFAIRFLMRRFGPAAARVPQNMQYAGPGFPGGVTPQPAALGSGAAGPSLAAPAAPSVATASLPQGFDAPGFERIAKLIFIRMQAANDSGDLEDLRRFSTPEMFAAFRLELQDRRAAPQQTDVVRLDAQVLDFAQEAEQQVVSVRFHGLIREEKDGAAAPFDEVWHLVKPQDGSREWAIAGIAQSEPA